MQRQINDVDELFEIKNFYYIGNYQHCINDALKIKKPSVEKDLYMYRSYIAQKKYRIVLDEIKPNDSSGLLPLRFIAEYFACPDKRDSIIQQIDEKVSKDLGSMDEIWLLSVATIYFNENMFESALKVLYKVDHLECMALSLQCLLRLNRIDLAKKVYETMQKKDDDATLTQLAQAWLNIEIGGEKLQDAYYIFQEFCDKFSPTVLLLNGQAVCFIGQEKYDEAENVLRESLDKDPNNYDTLVNLITLSQYTEKGSDVVNRYLTQLQDSFKDSGLVVEYNRKDKEFDRICTQYAVSNTTPVEQIVI